MLFDLIILINDVNSHICLYLNKLKPTKQECFLKYCNFIMWHYRYFRETKFWGPFIQTRISVEVCIAFLRIWCALKWGYGVYMRTELVGSFEAPGKNTKDVIHWTSVNFKSSLQSQIFYLKRAKAIKIFENSWNTCSNVCIFRPVKHQYNFAPKTRLCVFGKDDLVRDFSYQIMKCALRATLLQIQKWVWNVF